MNASDVMVRSVITIGPKALVSEAAKLLSENDIRAVFEQIESRGLPESVAF